MARSEEVVCGFDQAPVGLALIDAATGRFRRVNRCFCDLVGYSRSELEAKGWQAVSHPDDVARNEENLQRLSAGAIPVYAAEVRFLHRAGTVVWTNLTVSPLRGADDLIEGHIAVFEDISRRRQSEDAYRESAALIRSLSDNLPHAMLYQIVRAPDGRRRFAYVSDAVKRFYGCTPEEAMADAQRIYGKVLEEDFPRVYAEEEQALRSFTNFSTEVRIHNPEGGIRWSYFSSSPRRLDDGSTCWDGFEFDITEHKMTEKALRAMSSRQETLLTTIPDIIMETDDQKVYTWANSAGLAFFGQDVIGREASFYFAGDQQTFRAVQPIFDGKEEVVYLESWQRRQDGAKRLLAWWCRGFKDAQGKVIGALSSALDITEQRRLEQHFIQAQKMESVGRLAGGVAHEFNNNLLMILSRCDMLLETVVPGTVAHEHLSGIRKAASRSADLTRQLLAFARKDAVKKEVLDLNDTVRGMLQMLHRLIGGDVSLTWNLGEGLWRVEIDPTQVDQILANLAVNARDALGGTGFVAITTSNVTLDVAYCEAHRDTVPGDYVLMAVSDNGCGMDSNVLEHLFEPFFTTKEYGKGTGLGLATVYSIVKQNSGVIDVHSKVGEGTTFCIYLPRASNAPAPPSVETTNRRLKPGSETILLVEDDEDILDLAAAVLKKCGYTVLSAKSALEALRILEGHEGPVHLLVSDVVMAGMNGKALSEKVTALRPGIRTLFMSGYSADTIVALGLREGGAQFLKKPFSNSTLAAKVREMLDME